MFAPRDDVTPFLDFGAQVGREVGGPGADRQIAQHGDPADDLRVA
jgi:hypothetical protein